MSERQGDDRSDGTPGGPLDFDLEDEQRLAHRRDPDLPPEAAAPARVPPPARPAVSRYGWFIGVVVVLLFAYITLNTIRNGSSSNRGVVPGRVLAPFAAPLALGPIVGDANIATRADQAQRGRRPACSIRGPDVVNVCQLGAGRPLVLAFSAPADPRCARQLDVIERLRPRFPGVQFAAVAVTRDRAQLRSRIRRAGWGFPIAVDRDRAVFSLYGVVVCSVALAYPDRIAMKLDEGAVGEAALARDLRRLVAGSRRRGWSPPRA